MNYSKRRTKKRTKTVKAPPFYSDPSFLAAMFKNRFGRTPNEFIQTKLANGTSIDAAEYELNIILADISKQTNCVFYDFNYYYNKQVQYQPVIKKTVVHKTNRPENAGKAWSKEDDQLLITMYNGQVSKKEMCDTLKRSEEGLAARLVRLGMIKKRYIFRERK